MEMYRKLRGALAAGDHCSKLKCDSTCSRRSSFQIESVVGLPMKKLAGESPLEQLLVASVLHSHMRH